MSTDWVTAMDMCASAGIINYDAPAAILGQPSRYMGHPDFTTLPTLHAPLPSEYDTYNGNIVRPSSRKRKAFNTLLAVGGIAGVLALIKNGKLNLTTIKNFAKGTYNIVKKPFVWIANKLSSASRTP